MKFNPANFRTYDIRGIYPDDLDEGFAYNLGLAYANLFSEVKKVVVAREVREGSRELSEGLINGLLDAGCDVFEITEIVPVSIMSFVICSKEMDGGIMVTASHNPPEWNGFKLQLKDAYPVISETFEKLKVLFEKGNFKKAEKRGEIKKIDPREEYIKYLADKIKITKPLKVVLDCGNGGCNLLPEKIFKQLGCQVETLFGEFNSSFPHHLPDPYKSENLVDLQKRVVETKADIGFGYDGDGDRLGVIDAKGRIVKGDDYLIIFAREALKIKKGPVICEVRTSQAFIDDVKQNGGETFFSVAYHKAVLDKIIEKKAVFGGETTGHLYFPLEYYLYDDAIFASLKLAKIVAEKEDFCAYIDSLPRYFASSEIFINYPDETKKQAVARLIDLLRERHYKFIDVDGARIIFDNGWGLVRFSNTEPMIKIRFESKIKEDLIKIEKEVVDLITEVDIKLSEKNLRELG